MSVNDSQKGQTIPQAVSELLRGITRVLAAEINLAQREANEAFTRTRENGVHLVLSVIVAAFAIPPFIAFLVIGLGKLLNDQYWLSALFVSILFAVLGFVSSLLSLRSTRLKDLSLPETRRSLEEQRLAFQNKIRPIDSRSNRIIGKYKFEK